LERIVGEHGVEGLRLEVQRTLEVAAEEGEARVIARLSERGRDAHFAAVETNESRVDVGVHLGESGEIVSDATAEIDDTEGVLDREQREQPVAMSLCVGGELGHGAYLMDVE